MLETEFFRFALAPHEGAGREGYEAGVEDIASGSRRRCSRTFSSVIGRAEIWFETDLLILLTDDIFVIEADAVRPSPLSADHGRTGPLS